MTRTITDGNETGDPVGTGITRTTSGSVSTSTNPVHVGTNCWSIDATGAAAYVQEQQTEVLDRDYWTRAYFRFGGAPGALARLVEIINTGGGVVCTIRLATDRRVQLYDTSGNPIGATSSVLAVDTWHHVELHVRVNTAGNGVVGMRVDDTEVQADMAAAVSNTAINRWRFGKSTATTITNLYVDDVAVNDDQGGTDNTWFSTLAQPDPAPLANPNGKRCLNVPIGLYNVNNSPVKAGTHLYALRFVLDESVRLYRFIMGFNLEGVDTDGSGSAAPSEIRNPGGTGRSGYGDGNGGTIRAQLCTCNADGTPNLGNVLAEESVNAVDRYIASKTAFSTPGITQLLYFTFDVDLSWDTMYAAVVTNSHGSPTANWFSVNSPVCHEDVGGPHAANTLDRLAAGAIAGLDPRECSMWSTNNGSSWGVGAAVGGPDGLLSGYYDGVGGGEDGVRLPWYGYQVGSAGGAIKANQPYFAYTSAGAYTLRCKAAGRSTTLTEAGGYAPAGQSLGAVTVTNVRTSVSGQTASLGSGIVSGALNVPVTVEAGDEFTIANSGVACKAEADTFIVATFNVGDPAGGWPFTTDGQGSDRAELFAL